MERVGHCRRGRIALFSMGLVALVVAGCGPKNPETFSLKTGQAIERFAKFEGGAKVEIWVESEQDSDVDLFVFDASGKKVAVDERVDKNCYVTFKPESTQTFKIQVQNRTLVDMPSKNKDNRCTLKWEPK